MSHVSRIQIVITDLASLGKAAAQIGMELVEGQKTYKWYGTWVNDYSAEDAAYRHGIDPKDYGKCEHALRVKGNSDAYEIGLVKNPDGAGWVLVHDNWAGGKGLEAVAGKDAGNLRREYALHVSAKEMARRGFRTERVFNPVTGKERLRAYKA